MHTYHLMTSLLPRKNLGRRRLMGTVWETPKNEVCWLMFAFGNDFIQTNKLSLNACLLCAKCLGEEAL